MGMAEHYIDVRDTARLHLGALIHPDVSGERIFGFAEPYNWNSVLAIFRKMYPNKTLPEDLPNLGWDKTHPPTERTVWLLQQMGTDGFKSIEQSLREEFGGIE
jgi:hypothetical protein